MKENNLFKPVGKRLDNLNYLIQTKYPQDKWMLEPILPIFLSIIDSSSTIEQQQVVTRELNKVFDLYEFRYNVILENKIKMTQETLRMQFLSGVITESEYKTKLEELNTPSETKDSLNEHFVAGGIVGVGAINNPFEGRKKEIYEDAFEHFLSQKYNLNEAEEDIEEGKEVEEPSLYEMEEDEFNLDQAFKNSPKIASYDDVLEIVDSYGDYSTLDAFQGMFSEGEDISRDEYFKFFSKYIDDMSDAEYIKANWISIFDEDIYDKAGLNESDKPGTAKERSAMAKKSKSRKRHR